ncbi:5'-nucleotidase domain-containing protein 1-like [Sinocyclocheilus grahami]|uniref:5'-nucleotidase domain-containing protein 1-like n=1 Tax=Sinocyclocheilus grahami TaxID=75366 RepID=UPI0007AC8FF2|nr:PREDICTED: 5'-nucleotidase domain-containing protein 1-like [Sinocyclocheilus grahami]
MSEYFSLSECDVIGFDLDHTLCRYNLKETSRLIYESFARYLVEHKGYDKDLLLLTPATWDFCFKGLVVDLEEGNLIKLAEDGTVLRATHGTKNLSTDDIIKHYGPKREWKHFNSLNTSYTRSAKYYFYDNYFDLPGALLCARVVDMLNKRGAEITSDIWKDIVAAIDHNYNTSAFREDTGTYFPSVKCCPGSYLQPCSDAVKSWLRSMKNSGKILLLITSSHSDYCRLVCEHILGMDFEELFDIIITNALKPGFFSLVPQQRPFRTLVNDVEDSEGLPSLEKPGWYSQGNWPHLHELLKTMTNKSEPKAPSSPRLHLSHLSLRIHRGLPYPHLRIGRRRHLLCLGPPNPPHRPGSFIPSAPPQSSVAPDPPRPPVSTSPHRSPAPSALPRTSESSPLPWLIDSPSPPRAPPPPALPLSHKYSLADSTPTYGDSPSLNSKDQGMKSPSAVSNQWGSYFVDMQKNEGEETRRLTWCCHSIHTYSTMAIPSIEAIADLPLDFKFQRFSSDKPITTGYYPRPPDSLLKWEEN